MRLRAAVASILVASLTACGSSDDAALFAGGDGSVADGGGGAAGIGGSGVGGSGGAVSAGGSAGSAASGGGGSGGSPGDGGTGASPGAGGEAASGGAGGVAGSSGSGASSGTAGAGGAGGSSGSGATSGAAGAGGASGSSGSGATSGAAGAGGASGSSGSGATSGAAGAGGASGSSGSGGGSGSGGLAGSAGAAGTAGSAAAAGAAGAADGGVDACLVLSWCLDRDGDEFGSPHGMVASCVPPAPVPGAQWIEQGSKPDACSDCNDQNEEVHPGQKSCFSVGYVSSGTVGSVTFDYDCDGVELECKDHKKAGEVGCRVVVNPGGQPRCDGSGYLPTLRPGVGINPYCGSDKWRECVLADPGPNAKCLALFELREPIQCR